MKFLLDESAEYRLALSLKDHGHDVTAIAHDYRHALTDREVLAIAHSEQRTVVTNDSDFGELVFRDGQQHSGIILFRLPSGNTQAKIAALGRLLESHVDDLDQFLVIDARGVRVRRAGMRRTK